MLLGVTHLFWLLALLLLLLLLIFESPLGETALDIGADFEIPTGLIEDTFENGVLFVINEDDDEADDDDDDDDEEEIGFLLIFWGVALLVTAALDVGMALVALLLSGENKQLFWLDE